MLDHILKWIIYLGVAGAVLLMACMVSADEIDDLVPYIIQVESSGNPFAISGDYCRGLMQISEQVTDEFCENNSDWFIRSITWFGNRKNSEQWVSIYDGGFNKIVGTWYLRRIKNHYLKIDGKDYHTIERLLVSYNGGPTRMRRLLRQGKDWENMPHESVAYVRKILKLRKKGLVKP